MPQDRPSSGAGEWRNGTKLWEGEAEYDLLPDALEAGSLVITGLDGVEGRPFPTVGRGTYRSLAGVVVGGEPEVQGRVLHLGAFPA